jgi:hypothetical protein
MIGPSSSTKHAISATVGNVTLQKSDGRTAWSLTSQRARVSGCALGSSPDSRQLR